MRLGGLPARAVAVTLLFLLPLSLFPQAGLTCLYVEGAVRFEERALEIGEELSGDGVLRLEEGSYAELAHGDSRLRLIGPGEYYLSDLTAEKSSGSIAPSIGNRMRRLLRQDPAERLTTAGVRAEEAGRGEWADVGPASDLQAAAREALGAGRPDAAEELYRAALLYSTEHEDAIRLELSELLVGRGSNKEAAELTGEIAPDAFDDQRKGRYYLARAGALFGLQAYGELLSLVSAARNESLPQEARLYVELMAGEAFLAAGAEDEARGAFRRVVSIAPATPQAVAAKRLLADLSAD